MQDFSPKQFPEQMAAALIVGGGIDYRVNSRLSIRPFQGDYVNSYYNKLSAPGTSNVFSGVRLQAGLVVKFGLPKQALAQVSADCVANPEVVEAGAPVSISVTPNDFLPNRTLTYLYESNGGKVSCNGGARAAVDTTGLAPGSYTVTVRVVDYGKGKPQQSAQCQTSFKVNEPPKHAPTLSISAAPAAVMAGDIATITASGSSADNRPLSYNCTATAGQLSGNGPRFTLETAGVPDSTVVVNCTVSDDRDLTASASAPVKVNVPVVRTVPPPPMAKAKQYGTIGFERDARRPTRVDNEAKGELDRYADALAAAPDAKGVVVGHASAKEDRAVQAGRNFAAQRAVNTKDYVTKEKGIDPARIEPRIGGGDEQKVELWIVPAGTTFSQTGTTVVDEVKVKAVPRVARKKKASHRRAAPQEQ
jgi:outer membrane protein OmpA-like peptidoglycan-associated protein